MYGLLTLGKFIFNSRWTGGKYGVGKRISFDLSQQILDSINDGTLSNAQTHSFKHFNFQVPDSIPGFEQSLIHPEKGWHSKVEYSETLSSLAVEFMENFEKKFKGSLDKYDEIIGHGPTL